VNFTGAHRQRDTAQHRLSGDAGVQILDFQ